MFGQNGLSPLASHSTHMTGVSREASLLNADTTMGGASEKCPRAVRVNIGNGCSSQVLSATYGFPVLPPQVE